MITINNKHIITNKIVCIWQLFFSYVTFLSSEFIETVLVTFFDVVFVAFVDMLLATFIISSLAITALSTTLFKYLLFSQIHVLGFQLQSIFQVRYFLHSH